MSSRWGWFKDPSFPNHLFQRCHGPSIVFGVDGNFPKLKLKLENLSKNIKNIISDLRNILNKWHLRKVTVGIFKARLWHRFKRTAPFAFVERCDGDVDLVKDDGSSSSSPGVHPPAEGSCLMDRSQFWRTPKILSHTYQKCLLKNDSWIFNCKISNSASLPYCSIQVLLWEFLIIYSLDSSV